MRVPERVGAKRLARGRTPIDGAFLKRDPGFPTPRAPLLPTPLGAHAKRRGDSEQGWRQLWPTLPGWE